MSADYSRRPILTLALAALMALSATIAPAQQAKPAPTLKLGDPAPALSIEKWVKGSPVNQFEKGKIYVIEFWATWCPPCVASIPHLSALQKENQAQGLTIVGVTKKDPRNSLAKVEKMVTARGDDMAYTVAFDNGTNTFDAYMKAADQPGIPTAFVVNQDGKVVYIGDPTFLDTVIGRVAAGTWDIEKGTKEMEDLAKTFWGLPDEKDPKAALAKFEELGARYKNLTANAQDLKFELLMKAGETAEASTIGRAMLAKAVKAKDPLKMNQIAWTIVAPETSLKNRDLDLAMEAATQAADLTENKDPSILDTLARVYFTKGDLDQAIALQDKAVSLAEGKSKPALEKTLAEYKAAKK